jgi:hypothetical protein
LLYSFKINANIENPAACEVRSVIRFLNAINVRPAEIHRQIVEVYGEDVMNKGNVRKWCRLFNSSVPASVSGTDLCNTVYMGY